jgi:hypothetical protein
MQPTHRIERYLEHISPQLRDIVMELRSLVAAAAPLATETIQRKGLTYYYSERGGPVSTGICQIGFHDDHVRLAFIHGAFLPDPNGLLEGNRKYKRYIKIYSFEQAPWESLRALIDSSSRFDPRSL